MELTKSRGGDNIYTQEMWGGMKKSYFMGILGALIGGIIASIPWIVVYVYLNFIYSFLAFLVAMGALYGYQLFNGKVDKKLPFIIAIVSFISITIATLVIIPSLLIVNEEIPLTIANFKYLYSSSEFVSAIIKDYVISIIFTFLGISSVIKNLSFQTSQNVDNIKININNNSKKERELIKKFFIDNNALSRENAISLDSTMNINFSTLNILRNENVIVYEDGKFYYDINGENNNKKRQSKALKISSIIIIISIIIGIVCALLLGKSDLDDDLNEKSVNYYVSPYYMEYVDDLYDDTFYYVPNDDLSGDSGYINVYYYDSNDVYSEEWVSYYENLVVNDYGYELENVDHFINFPGYDVSYFNMVSDYGYNFISYVIFGGHQIGVVEITDYNEDKTLLSDGKKIAETFYWID